MPDTGLPSQTMIGYQAHITLPHEAAFELYHNALSLCSMKVRVCLAELRVPYKAHHIDLIETGAYENVRKAFTRINPGRTVPVLVHNGHPVYESHEQIRYAAAHAPAGHPSLVPEPQELRTAMERWIDCSSLTDDPIANSHLSAGNAIPGQTLPLFATMIERIPYRNIFEGFLEHFDKRRPLMFALMKLMGLEALRSVSLLRRALERSRHDLHIHLDGLEQQLATSGGPWILGPGYTLADVSWLAIFERLRQADALTVFVDPARRPACAAYWAAQRQRPAYAEAITAYEHPIVVYGTRRIVAAKAADPTLKALLEGT